MINVGPYLSFIIEKITGVGNAVVKETKEAKQSLASSLREAQSTSIQFRQLYFSQRGNSSVGLPVRLSTDNQIKLKCPKKHIIGMGQ